MNTSLHVVPDFVLLLRLEMEIYGVYFRATRILGITKRSWIIDLVICHSVKSWKCNFTSQGIHPKLIRLGMQLCVPNGETFRKLLEANDNLEQRKLNTFSCNIFLKKEKLFAKWFQRLHSSAGRTCMFNKCETVFSLNNCLFHSPICLLFFLENGKKTFFISTANSKTKNFILH